MGGSQAAASVIVEMVTDTREIHAVLMEAFGRFLDVYAQYGAHRYHGWVDYGDPQNYKGPTFWSEDDCIYRLALELEREFPHEVHLELPVARWSFADFDESADKRERVDLVVRFPSSLVIAAVMWPAAADVGAPALTSEHHG